MTPDVLRHEIFIGSLTKFQNYKRLSRVKWNRHSVISHQINFEVVETLLLQRYIHHRIEGFMYVLIRSIRIRLSVYDAKKWSFGVSNRHVFHQIAVDVNRMNVTR